MWDIWDMFREPWFWETVSQISFWILVIASAAAFITIVSMKKHGQTLHNPTKEEGVRSLFPSEADTNGMTIPSTGQLSPESFSNSRPEAADIMPVAEGKTLNVVGSVKRDWTPVSTNEVTERKGEAEKRLAAVPRDVVMEDQAKIQLHLPFMDLHVEVPSELLESKDAGREESRERCRGK